MNPRPRYCRQEDRANETQTLSRIVEAMRRRFAKDYHADHAGQADDFDGFLFEGDRLAALVEIKRRTGSGARFETWHIAKDKVDRCVRAAAEKGCKFCLVFVWDDGIFMQDVTKLGEPEVQQGGRWDRGDALDVEAMNHYPREKFFKVT